MPFVTLNRLSLLLLQLVNLNKMLDCLREDLEENLLDSFVVAVAVVVDTWLIVLKD